MVKAFPELDEYTIEAADGHFIDHACHTEKNSKGKVYAAGGIYALNLRSGLLRFLCLVTNGTQRHQEIPVLRDHIEKQNKGNNSSQKHLYVYDKAVTDFVWWDRQKRHANYMISMLKENSIATLVESIPFDSRHEINTGVEAYSVYENKGIKFNVVDYRDPETGKLHRFVTTLPMTINPGTIAMLYFKRWTIEKTFNNTKSNFKETKAWSSNTRSLENQMRLTAMSYNLMRVFEEISKTQQPELIHPSDKKYSEALEIRQQQAQKRDRFVNPLFSTRCSSFSIPLPSNSYLHPAEQYFNDAVGPKRPKSLPIICFPDGIS
ncbi:transposase [Bathymodiolus japonicus methanotrophic gill symbiont]|uniref:transposase n=1 Tax=Bathymodiolus japonicus methanotrophic gill symbiont TaxID=113269 RepID=UPI001C8E32D7|nr:transposase [Bathymodiolus japonicus methanotrophic gill symbiont]